MIKILRINEYKVLIFRIALVYVFYFVARVLFYLYNKDYLKVDSVSDFFSLAYYGIAFDTTAILYVNLLFILFSILPFWKNTSSGYQKFLFYLYFTTNLLAYSTNFIDFIYFKYTLGRTTIAALSVVENETNLGTLFLSFLIDYWHVFLLLIATSFLWIFLYKKIKVQITVPNNKIIYFGFSIVSFMFFAVFIIGGIRGGDFQKSTRPINLVDASKHVKKIQQSDLVLNTPFAIIRTLFSNAFKKVEFSEVTPQLIASTVQPIKEYHNFPATKPNVVLFIIESYGREYSGAFNKWLNIPDYKSHSPFIDSLAQHSLIFPNAYANGRQSIHGMTSILAGIPTFKDAFTSSPYSKQKIESLVSTLKDKGYSTSFFHGAANGSMGFQGFGNILGIDNYYGRTEFNDDSEYDGYWGIWDEPFLQFMKQQLDKEKDSFFATVFTVSSHEPYIIPKKYKNKFKEGAIPMHKCAEYTDYAIKRFFETAKKSKWFDNTIFIMVADHGNQIFYEEYTKPVSRFSVPILIYKPNSTIKGVDMNLAQQIDIYPTVLDLIGYDKPFRSWGNSLVDADVSKRFVVNSTGNTHQFLKGNYICVFDGSTIIGYYDKNDRLLSKNLISKPTKEMNEIGIQFKAFYKDYMDRIIDKKLTSK